MGVECKLSQRFVKAGLHYSLLAFTSLPYLSSQPENSKLHKLTTEKNNFHFVRSVATSTQSTWQKHSGTLAEKWLKKRPTLLWHHCLESCFPPHRVHELLTRDDPVLKDHFLSLPCRLGCVFSTQGVPQNWSQSAQGGQIQGAVWWWTWGVKIMQRNCRQARAQHRLGIDWCSDETLSQINWSWCWVDGEWWNDAALIFWSRPCGIIDAVVPSGYRFQAEQLSRKSFLYYWLIHINVTITKMQ